MGLDIKTNFTNENTFCPSQTLFYQLNSSIVLLTVHLQYGQDLK